MTANMNYCTLDCYASNQIYKNKVGHIIYIFSLL